MPDFIACDIAMELCSGWRKEKEKNLNWKFKSIISIGRNHRLNSFAFDESRHHQWNNSKHTTHQTRDIHTIHLNLKSQTCVYQCKVLIMMWCDQYASHQSERAAWYVSTEPMNNNQKRVSKYTQIKPLNWRKSNGNSQTHSPEWLVITLSKPSAQNV